MTVPDRAAQSSGSSGTATHVLNIVVLNDTCDMDGGSARIAIEDAYALARSGHRVTFFSACGTPPQDKGGIEWISLGQKNILMEPRRWVAMTRGLWNFKASTELKKLLATLAAENTVVHLHSWSKALSGSVVRAVHGAGFKLVCTLHDYFLLCPNGGLYDYPSQTACTLKPMSVACVARNCDSRAYAHKIWRVLRQVIWRYLAGIPRRFDCTIAVSAFAVNKMAERGWDTASLKVIDNLPVSHQRALQPAEDRASVIYAGRVASEKGVDLYLAACDIAAVNAEVLGDGPALPQLKALWPRANFKGWQQSAALQERLSKALALVVPSRCYETYGMVTAEAAAAGVAVIVADQGAAAELVENEATGLLFRNGDANDLASKIAMLQANPMRAFKMGEAAYRQFWLKYDQRKQQRIARLEACYLQALESRA